MGSVLTPPRSAAPRPSRRTALIVAAAIAIGVALIGAAQWLAPSKRFVPRVTVVNPTPYHLEVEARGVDRAHGIALGALGPNQTREFHDVIDQGREWIFDFSLGSDEAGEIRIPRPQLVQDQWKITVPDSVAQHLRSAGVPPSPPE